MSHPYPRFDRDALLARDPSTPPAELARIAAARRDLHPALAANPTSHPALVEWLGHSPDPAVQMALAARSYPGSVAGTVHAGSVTGSAHARRGLWVVVLAALLVLVLAGVGLGLVWLSGGDVRTRTYVQPADSWSNGAEKAWHLPGELIIGVSQDETMIVTYEQVDLTYVYTTYDVSKEEPEAIHREESASRALWWLLDDQLHIGGELVDIRTGERKRAPWSATAHPIAQGEDIILVRDCSSRNCLWQGWESTSAKEPAWQIDDLGLNTFFHGDLARSPFVWIMADDAFPRLVDTRDASMTEYTGLGRGLVSPRLASDGWLLCGREQCATLSLEGAPLAAPFSEKEHDGNALDLGAPWVTVQNVKDYLDSGDMSWSKLPGLPSGDCEGVEIAGVTMENSARQVHLANEECRVLGEGYLSPDGKTVFLSRAGIYDLDTGRQLFAFDDPGDYYYLATERILIREGDSGGLTGYRPAR